MTPIEKHGGIYFKRGDLYRVAGTNGCKAQVIATMAKGAAGLITSGPRLSSQSYICARVAAKQGIPFRCHMPRGAATAEMEDVLAHGGEIIQHKCGYNNVLANRAAEDAKGRAGWVVVPLWLRGPATVQALRGEVANVPTAARRVVVVVGSGMTLAAVLHGLCDQGRSTPVLGVCVGADPGKALDAFGPFGWRQQCTLVQPTGPATAYDKPLYGVQVGGIKLDPRYEAKAAEYLQPGDLFWVAGYSIHHKE